MYSSSLIFTSFWDSAMISFLNTDLVSERCWDLWVPTSILLLSGDSCFFGVSLSMVWCRVFLEKRLILLDCLPLICGSSETQSLVESRRVLSFFFVVSGLFYYDVIAIWRNSFCFYFGPSAESRLSGLRVLANCLMKSYGIVSKSFPSFISFWWLRDDSRHCTWASI